ncbi:peptide chain release factor 2 [Tessaracoccus sp. OH4464_COT-324]|uniref:peptide chain release factor 2 n=1 Tax=Tessaracoccus sp. OH4464_COT-324 TaxID=2491059 RepID=UPI000F63AF02|nr:peptide chain release factor 2 [Tessaracoccus sp. OH4464_COT-324]
MQSGGWRVEWLTVAHEDLVSRIQELAHSLESIEAVADLPKLREEIAVLQEEAVAPDLWENQENAQRVTSMLSAKNSELERLEGLRGRLDDAGVMLELAAEEADVDTAEEVRVELGRLAKEIEALEVRTLLSGEYDPRDALVTIRAEAGGVDAADFAEMLMRMYLRWADRHGYAVEIYDTSYAEEAGLKSATFAVKAPFAYGTLSVEQGTHRLVRISPFDNQGRRQTSFAGVEVLPVTEETDHIDIPESDIRVDVFRSSGPGGQSVNTTDSAVRITHLPTGLVVSCQNEKSQIQNKAAALRVLQSRLLERARQEREAEMNALKGDGGNSWGAQMRSYVMNPYQMVKDLRTEHEVGNPAAVFDGEIDDFIDAGIRWRKKSETGA